MAVIKSGASTDNLTVDPTSKAARVTLYDTSGNIISPALDHTTAVSPESVRLTDGTNFYKATTPADTQPVSIAGTVAVSGTFFQATQPVSIAGTVQTDDVSSGNTGAAVPIEAIQIGLNKSGTLVAALADANGNLSVNIADVGGSVAVAKGVQGSAAIPTQDFKDSGRVIKVFTASFTAATAEAMVNLTPVSDGTVGTAGTTFTVTAGKRFRIQAIFLTCFNVTAAIHACQVNLRMSASGAVTTASPIIGTVGASTAAATIDLAASQAQSLPDGLELSGTMQFGISQIGIALAGQTVVLVGYEY